MTKEEAKSCIQTIELLRRLAFNVHGVMDIIDAQNCDKIISMLSQGHCGDCISRTEAMRAITDEWVRGKHTLEGFTAALYNLPPVIPQSKTGHWIYDKNIENWRCSECGETPKTLGYCGTADFMAEHFKYCNHCGIRMVEPTERRG